jgi:malyl-CoA/(S)-citramalyl-CoA lyase
MRAAERDGHGAVTLDNRMLDLANVRMAERILRFAS